MVVKIIIQAYTKITILGFDGVMNAESKLKKKSIAFGFATFVKKPIHNPLEAEIGS